MTKFRVKLCTLLATVFVACVMCGVCMFTFADGAVQNSVINGWNSAVTRDGETADGGGVATEDGFAKYTSVKNGDVISYSGAFHSPKSDQLVRTAPFRLTFILKGEGKITWEMSRKDSDGNVIIFYKASTIAGGAAVTDANGLSMDVPRTVAKGKPVDLVFGGFHLYGGEYFYVNEDGSCTRAGGVLNDNEVFFKSEAYTGEFDLSVKVEGEFEEVSVKAGESLHFSQCDPGFIHEGYEIGTPTEVSYGSNYQGGVFTPANHITGWPTYHAFKGYEVNFAFALATGEGEADPMPYVTVGGVRVDTDATKDQTKYGSKYFGMYRYRIPADAESAQLSVTSAEFTVSYANGGETLLETYLKNGDKAYEKNFAVAGKRITGWYADAALTQAFDFNTALTADTTLYAKTVDVLVVNFKDGDEVLSFQNIDNGAKAVQPADPQKAGMTFIGWFTAPDGKTAFDFDKPITATTDVYAVFANNVTAKVLGFNGKGANTQSVDVPVMTGHKLTEDMMPSFGQITGFPEYTNIELVWYTDATMAEKVDFGANGVTVEGPCTFVAAIKDKDIDVANEYVRPNADGWDRNRSGGKDADGNVLTANQTLAPNSKYGSAEAMKSVDGYSDIKIDYVGYIANTRKFDVTKDIYLSYTLDSKNESANDPDGPKHDLKYLFVGMYNSLTGALISQGQIHEPNFGSFAAFGHRVNTEVQNNENMGAGKINVLTGGSSENNSFVYEEGKPVDLKITIGTENTKIYQLKEGNWVEIATMDVTQKMFPDGMYLVLETTRVTYLSARASQVSTVTKGAVSNGTFTIDTAEAATGLLSGERVYFTATPADGYQFSEDGVFADGAKVSVGYDETKKSYYFNMPFGASEMTVKFSVPVTFMADGKEVNEKLYVLAGEVIDEFDVEDAPEKAGHSFAGWFEDETLTQAFDFENTVVTKAITLYAKYEKNQYTITFMDGENKYKTATAAYGDKFVAPEVPEKDGFTFVGWFTDKECTKEFDFNTAVSDTVTVYAKWEANQRGCGSVAAVSASAAAAVVLLTVAAVALAKKKKAR